MIIVTVLKTCEEEIYGIYKSLPVWSRFPNISTNLSFHFVTLK